MRDFFSVVRKPIRKELIFALLNQAILSLGAVSIIVILSNILLPEVFGRLRFLASVLAICAFFSLPGIGPVILQRVTVYSQRDFWRAIMVQFYWGLGASLGAAFFGLVFYWRGDQDLAEAFLISGLLAPVANLYLMPGLALAGLKRFKAKLFVDTLTMSVIVIGVLIGSWMTGTVVGTTAWYFGLQAVVTITTLTLVVRLLPLQAPDSRVTLTDSHYGKQLTLFQIPFTLLPALEKALVFLLLGPAALAIYVIVTLPVEHILAAFRSFMQFSALPYLQHSEDQSSEIQHWFMVAVGLSLLTVATIVLFAWLLLPVLFSSYTSEARPLIYLSSLAALFLPAQVYLLALIVKRRLNRLFTYAALSIVSDVLIFVLLTTFFGLLGSVLAKILIGLASALVGRVLYRSGLRPFEI